MKLSTQQIGQCGVLLVQQKLLLHGVESAPMTTDSGIDLVAYSPRKKDAVTVQVKANWKSKPAGGKGKASLGWWVPEGTPAAIIAFVDLERNRVWLVRTLELSGIAQQHPKGRFHFFMSVDPTAKDRRDRKAVHDYDFEKYLLENRVHQLF